MMMMSLSIPTITEPTTSPATAEPLPTEILQQLATIVGIQTNFIDAFGTAVETTPQALASLIVLLLQLEDQPTTLHDWETLLARVAEAETHKALPPYFVFKPTVPVEQQRLFKIFRTPILSALLQQSQNNTVTIEWMLTNLNTKQTGAILTGTWELTNTNRPIS